ncbi:GAF domain-containing protein [Limosilactobacillus sp. STM2_1]|uniref:GAF domain-containing protein n=1 Tax=Limosilactobacillus rudii TaxID=2759755 RepID=A0A7W3ULY3_9LACO|nr:GAF domain-containing protein [Limosilactobacillus rudii]MBB1079896.1 GAF domain-containing protein [Limosilactobacillus rudii]MBB1097974.1 GAF domain-containing protein [Limosilactobacillus rudii]MCD7135043.1 GAF domain-containing protein [Limosilactobacillus rudii]
MPEISLLIAQLKSLLTGEHNKFANLANVSALLMQNLSEINWVGFYLFDPEKDELVLGPFQGKVACMHIKLGKGVCGTSAKEQTTIAVDDVQQFKGYIACDSSAKSELVIPLIKDSQLFGVLDLDSPLKGRFDSKTINALEEFCQTLVKVID